MMLWMVAALSMSTATPGADVPGTDVLAAAAQGGAAQSAAAADAETPAGVENAQRAWQNWTLNCQGCHRPDGTGSDTTSPSLAGTVAKFLWVPGGREYLGRVPGVATSGLSNADLAELMNWMLWRFDKEHLPSTFQPFTASEIGQLRTQPLRLEASQMRTDLLKKAGESGAP
jgi:mono/diheme cytochrome c family protein